MNDRKKPILLHTEYQKGKIKVMIFGTTGEFPQVKLSSKIVEYLPAEKDNKRSQLGSGSNREGKRPTWYDCRGISRVYFRGKTVSRELISKININLKKKSSEYLLQLTDFVELRILLKCARMCIMMNKNKKLV